MIVDTAEKLRLASQSMPKVWNGRESILKMRDTGFKYWRQEEWIEFYFKFLCQKHFAGIIDMPGKKYNNTEFDAFREISWDFKAHAANTTNHTVITNDAETIVNTISHYGYYGVILVIGEVDYNDEERIFRKWQNRLISKQYRQEINRINKGAMSRYYKIGFVLSEIHFICLNGETLNQCSGLFQTGFRNTDGSSKRTKITINIHKIPDAALVATEIFYGKINPDEVFQDKTNC